MCYKVTEIMIHSSLYGSCCYIQGKTSEQKITEEQLQL